MRRYRNPDPGIQRLRRAHAAAPGDLGVAKALVRALRRAGESQEAMKVQVGAMVASGRWIPWPTIQRSITSLAEAREERDLDRALVQEMAHCFGESPVIVVPHVLWEHYDDLEADIDTQWFTDGPYLVRAGDTFYFDSFEADRELQGFPPGERGLIPLWEASGLVRSREWGDLPQTAFTEMDFVPGDRLVVDGPVITERPDGTWHKEPGWLLRHADLERFKDRCIVAWRNLFS